MVTARAPRIATAGALVLVPAALTDEDAGLVMRWRNDPVTRAVSFHGDEKTWPAFRGEYAGYFQGTPLAPRFGVVRGERVGFVRFRPCVDPEGLSATAVDIGVNVAPEARGRGVGTALLVAASEVALAAAEVVLAEVRPGNNASTRAFLAAGYAPIDDGTHDVDGEPVPVLRYVLRRG